MATNLPTYHPQEAPKWGDGKMKYGTPGVTPYPKSLVESKSVSDSPNYVSTTVLFISVLIIGLLIGWFVHHRIICRKVKRGL